MSFLSSGGLSPLGDLADKLSQASEDPAGAADVRLRLEVHGGQSGDRYDFNFEVLPVGTVAMELRDDLAGQRLEQASHQVPREEVAQLFALIDVEGLLVAAQSRPQFPPDSLVGRLVVAIDGQEIQTLFMADKEQAATAGLQPAPAVMRVVEAIFSMAERTTGMESLAP